MGMQPRDADMSSNPTSIYHPLPTPSSIRLLRLLKSEGSSGVRVKLDTFCLTDPACPPFFTVSYTWGEGFSNELISVNGCDKQVLRSLMPLLQMLCSGSCPDFNLQEDWFWIDSICIDQANINERAAQVKLMGQLYRQAAQTIVWLGEETEDAKQGLDFILTLSQSRISLRQAVKRHQKKVPPELEGHPGWKSLERLLSNPWWRRVWTLQEFTIPARLKLYCGTKSVSRLEFRRGLGSLELCGPTDAYINPQVWMTAWNRRRISHWYDNADTRHKMPLVSLMAFCGDYGATDSRDRIWALHSLAREEDRQMIGHPTYGIDEFTLYTRLVKSFIDNYKSLDIICYSQIFSNRENNWPSWVPDWSVPVARPSVVPLMVSQSANPHLANLRPPNGRHTKREGKVAFNAGGDMVAGVKFCETAGHLTCQGLSLDMIDGLGSSHCDQEIAAECTSPINIEDAKNVPDRERILESLVRSMVLDRQDKFLEFRAPTRQYIREMKSLAAACVADASGENAAPPWFVAWWRFNNQPALRIRGFTVGDLCVGKEGKDSAREGTAAAVLQPIPKTSKSFFARFRGNMKASPRRLLVTSQGYVGIAPKQAQKGDLICVLFGCSVPVVLRPCQTPSAPDAAPIYEVVGECYVDGFMEGEMLDMMMPRQEFTLK